MVEVKIFNASSVKALEEDVQYWLKYIQRNEQFVYMINTNQSESRSSSNGASSYTLTIFYKRM